MNEPYVARKQINANRWHLVPRDPDARPRCFLEARDGGGRYAFTRAICGEPVLDGVAERDDAGDSSARELAELCTGCEGFANEDHARAVAE